MRERFNRQSWKDCVSERVPRVRIPPSPPNHNFLRDFLDQIRKGLENHLYLISLFSALAIPDICGAIESDNGEANRQKYESWFNRYVALKYDHFLDGKDCYYFRCSLLHQGSSQHIKNTYKRIIFVEPLGESMILHNNILNDALNIDVKIFCKDLISGAEKWLIENESTELYKINSDKFMRRYPTGLSPYIDGTPVIS